MIGQVTRWFTAFSLAGPTLLFAFVEPLHIALYWTGVSDWLTWVHCPLSPPLWHNASKTFLHIKVCKALLEYAWAVLKYCIVDKRRARPLLDTCSFCRNYEGIKNCDCVKGFEKCFDNKQTCIYKNLATRANPFERDLDVFVTMISVCYQYSTLQKHNTHESSDKVPAHLYKLQDNSSS
jgi:hypothetical protein